MKCLLNNSEIEYLLQKFTSPHEKGKSDSYLFCFNSSPYVLAWWKMNEMTFTSVLLDSVHNAIQIMEKYKGKIKTKLKKLVPQKICLNPSLEVSLKNN